MKKILSVLLIISSLYVFGQSDKWKLVGQIGEYIKLYKNTSKAKVVYIDWTSGLTSDKNMYSPTNVHEFVFNANDQYLSKIHNAIINNINIRFPNGMNVTSTKNIFGKPQLFFTFNATQTKPFTLNQINMLFGMK
ncbi:hypothetical protein [Elizabethkingia miricola]|uniref:hypothetical protein n=1 Tax=Elizabethkingia miricola TaxID=172045 RepID=UPI000B354B05|nr:hypothetical protein [Elizabethkingia miricola]